MARANQNKDYHIFEEYAYYLVGEVRQKRVNHIFKVNGNIYAFESTTIDLCLSVFWWAKFYKKKGGVKVHTLYDVETHPAFFHITEASVHDSKAMNEIPYEPALIISLTAVITTSRCCIKFIKLKSTLLSEQKRTSGTNPSNGNVGCLRMCCQRRVYF
ncbi:transposase [Bacteroides faecalis]|uniref:transposase n=1 Tax=Bacteroides faecalis TaxID=2447885 RepID=UPI0021D352EA|nr:transposase [Bacteroides faecalis]